MVAIRPVDGGQLMDDILDFVKYLIRECLCLQVLDEWWNGGGGTEPDGDPAGSGG